MERLAPNTAALDTPSVEGEAMELFSVVCIIRPETDSPAPAMTAARTRGIRIFQMIRTAAGSPDFVSALRQSPRDIWDEPMNYIDVISRMQIEALLLEYQPTILFVEHDKAFCDNVATKVVKL